MNAKPTALDAYFARAAAIHAKLERLQQLANDHFGYAPDALNWGHVGDLGRVEAGLDELLAMFGGTLPARRDRIKRPSMNCCGWHCSRQQWCAASSMGTSRRP